MQKRPLRLLGNGLLAILLVLFTGAQIALADDDSEGHGETFELEVAKWKARRGVLKVKGENAGRRAQVILTDAASGAVLAEFKANKEGSFRKKIKELSVVPCRVRAVVGDASDEKDVANAPADCNTGGSDDSNSGGDDNSTGGGDGNTGGMNEYHQNLTYNGPGTCLECHDNEAHDVFGSTHYQWKGIAPDMVNQPYLLQGKHAGAVNTYCGNIEGNWNGCSSCHVGLGAEPAAEVSQAQLENIDCMVCHQEGYKRKKVDGVMVPDIAKMAMDMDEAVRTVHKPTRANCLQCHAKAGGGDAVKRGDLSLATADTNDLHYDVHMARTGADLSCQDCHAPQNHRFPGKGSDLRPTDLDVVLECGNSSCHSATPHDDRKLNRHTEKVACQTCHIPVYAKDAADSDASEATEIDRSWEAGTHHTSPPFHPVLTKANDLTPEYLHWNRASDNYLLGDVIEPNPQTGTYQTSVPKGSVNDAGSKLYPFKYKTSDYPLRTASNQLIALDTSVFFATADADAATMAGLENMGFDPSDDYQWVTTDTYQLLNHQVSSHDDALRCTSCHLNTARMDLQGDLGYAPKDKNRSTCASGCHKAEKAYEWDFGDWEDYEEYHKKHDEKHAACSECHSFDR